MKKHLKKIRSKIIHSKVYAQRAMGYISLINAGMLLFLTASNLEKYGFDIKMEKYLIPIFVVGASFLILVGYIEDKLGFFQEEHNVVQKRSPQMKEILERLERIEDKLK